MVSCAQSINADLVAADRDESYASVRSRLEHGVNRVLDLIGRLTDEELMSPGVFPWAGKWPLARWISINTVRQYTTARTFVRRALRDLEAGPG